MYQSFFWNSVSLFHGGIYRVRLKRTSHSKFITVSEFYLEGETFKRKAVFNTLSACLSSCSHDSACWISRWNNFNWLWSSSTVAFSILSWLSIFKKHPPKCCCFQDTNMAHKTQFQAFSITFYCFFVFSGIYNVNLGVHKWLKKNWKKQFDR